MPFNIGPFELLLVLILALLVLGPGKLPEVGNALGKTIREFRRASNDAETSLNIDAPATRATPAQPSTDPRDKPVERVGTEAER
jgi:sec-independent protein translocase protein TatA